MVAEYEKSYRQQRRWAWGWSKGTCCMNFLLWAKEFSALEKIEMVVCGVGR